MSLRSRTSGSSGEKVYRAQLTQTLARPTDKTTPRSDRFGQALDRALPAAGGAGRQ
jgi:hypothetical protein